MRVEVVDSGRLREPWKIVSGILEIKRLIREHQADLVLGWMTKAHIYGGAAARLAKIPAIYFQMGLPDNSAVDRLSRKVPAAGALACSNFAAILQQSFVRQRVIGVPLAADFTRFSDAANQDPAEIRRKLGLDVDRPIVGIVGRLQHWKGMHVYVEAMARVFEKVPECQGVIVGGMFKFEPEYEPWLRERIKSLAWRKRSGWSECSGTFRNGCKPLMSWCTLQSANRLESWSSRRCRLASRWWQPDLADPKKSLPTTSMGNWSLGTNPTNWRRPF